MLSFRTDKSGQTVYTQTRLLLEEQSDRSQHCLPFCLHLLDTLLCGKATLFEFKGDYRNFSDVQIFRNFTVRYIFWICSHEFDFLLFSFMLKSPHLA